jgi:hypothetical protein
MKTPGTRSEIRGPSTEKNPRAENRSGGIPHPAARSVGRLRVSHFDLRDSVFRGLHATLLAGLLVSSRLWVAQAAESQVLTVAVFDFETKEDLGKDFGAQAATLVNAQLSAEPDLITVERAELAKVLGEQELGLSGTVSTDTAAKVGHLTGAKVLVTGRVFKADKELILVAKIIGTETSRVYGEVVKSAAKPVTDLAAELAQKIAKTAMAKADTLVAKVKSREDRVAAIKKALKTDKFPAVSVRIAERHFGGPTIDPAAETEFGRILGECGFTLVDDKSEVKPEIEFVGEAFSEFGMRKGNLVSCRARVEIKVRDKATGQLLAVDRQTSVAVDLSEQIAGKAALQQAAAELAERVIPKVKP